MLNSIINANLIPLKVTDISSLHARIYYVFETEKNGNIFDVAIWGGYDEYSIFVNGLEVKVDDVFYDVIMPFLPEAVAEELKTFLEILRGNEIII